jgi:arginyl-tRNA synthetase
VKHESMEDALERMISKGLVYEDYGTKKAGEEEDLNPDADVPPEEEEGNSNKKDEKTKKDEKKKDEPKEKKPKASQPKPKAAEPIKLSPEDLAKIKEESAKVEAERIEKLLKDFKESKSKKSSDSSGPEKPALLVDLEKYKLGKTVVKKKDGTYLYITRDIGGAIERWEKFKFDKMIFAQFQKVLELLDFEWANRLQHVNFGMLSLSIIIMTS